MSRRVTLAQHFAQWAAARDLEATIYGELEKVYGDDTEDHELYVAALKHATACADEFLSELRLERDPHALEMTLAELLGRSLNEP